MTVDVTSIYLDYNATSPLRPKVAEFMQEVMALPLNASSVHKQGRRAKQVVETTRSELAEFLNCWPQEIIWCSSASEANNSVIRQFHGGACLVSSIEHSAILSALENVETIPVTGDGVVDLEWLERRLQGPNMPSVISVMYANNETGVIQPIKDVVALARQYNILTHCDAVQAVGKVPLDFTSLGVDYMTVSFHKNGGPVGVAALVVKNGVQFQPLIRGGGQEFNRRAGSENVTAIAGVCQLFKSWSFDELPRMKALISDIEQQLPPEAVIAGSEADRLGSTSCIIMPGVSQEVQLMRMDLAGICVSAGSACSSGKIESSHVLRAMGVDNKLASSAIRVSAGWNTTKADCEAFVKEWLGIFTSSKQDAKIAT